MAKTIHLIGSPATGKTTRATALFNQHVAEGAHVLLYDDGAVQRSSHPSAPNREATVIIRTRTSGGPLQVSGE
jgi:adenylate kinase family enzyme